MSVMLRSGEFSYEALEQWEELPEGVNLVECPGVAVNSRDEVHVLTRNTDFPVMVFDTDGTYKRTFGKGIFSDFVHGISIGSDDAVYCADGGNHTVTKFTPDGTLVFTLGTRDKPSGMWGGEPFNKPTHAFASPNTGDIFVSDGYGNSRIHVYSGSGDYKFSWGSPGIDAGQFIRPHNIAVDSDDKVYVVDREAHRIQIFDARGNFLTMWNNIHRPDSMVLWNEHIYVGELNGMGGVDEAPGLGHRVTVYDLQGNRVCIFGSEEEGEGPGQFIAPHGIAVDSKGDVYVAEVSFTIRGSKMDPPKVLRSFSKYARQ